VLLYPGMRDRLFSVPGKWNLTKCANPDCGLIWLDPMPLEEDIGKAYVNYYTHQDTNEYRNRLRTRLFRFVKEGYWAKKYGYFKDSVRGWNKLLGNLIYLHPLKHAETDMMVRYLPAQSGRLLDVGCGSGEWHKFMQQMGWLVEGIDFDLFAVEKAKNKGLQVKLGTLEAQEYPDNHFDAITMTHVIEHAHSPLRLLRECHRILKPGARLVVVTPNSQSLGHSIFKENWRGLEPPRHLHLMNMATLKSAVIDAGFGIATIRTLMTSPYILHQSYALRNNAASRNGDLQLPPLESLIARILTIIELVVLLVNRNAGEELVLMAKKRK